MIDKRIKTLSANIRAERSRKGYTQEKLAELTNVSLTTVGMIERENQVPSAFTLLDIARALEVDVNELFKGL